MTTCCPPTQDTFVIILNRLAYYILFDDGKRTHLMSKGRRVRDRMAVYNYLCNECQSELTFCVRILLRRAVLDTTLCDKVCQ
jgi:hypothetical protein